MFKILTNNQLFYKLCIFSLISFILIGCNSDNKSNNIVVDDMQLTYDSSTNSITIQFAESEFVKLYSVTETNETTLIYQGSSTSFTHSNLLNATTYQYQVAYCQSASDCQNPSAIISIATQPSFHSFERLPSQDFDTLAASNTYAIGIWANEATMLITDFVEDKIYAYDFTTQLYAMQGDFNHLVAAGNDNLRGLWSNGSILWVVDNTDDKLYAYDLNTMNRLSDQDFNSLVVAGNQNPYGIWSNGETMWVVDNTDKKIYAYKMSSKVRDSQFDFDSLVADGVTDPRGLWSNGTTLWVSDSVSKQLFAYHLSSKTRDSAKDFTTLVDAGNVNIRDIWSNNEVMWVADHIADKLYAYNMPPTILVDVINTTQINLHWSADQGATHYILSSSTQQNSDFQPIYAGSSTQFEHQNLSISTEYYYNVVACTVATQPNSCTDGYGVVKATTDDGYQLSFEANTNAIVISWLVATKDSYFRLYSSTAANTNFTEVYQGEANTFAHTNLDKVSTYYYKLRLCGDSSVASCSSLTFIVADESATTISAGATATLSFANTAIGSTINWVVSEGNYFRLYASTEADGNFIEIYDGNSQTYQYQHLQSATSYFFKLQLCVNELLSSCLSIDNQLSTQSTTQPNITRNSAQDFTTLRAAGNINPSGLWSNGTTMWVSDVTVNKIYAYDLQTKQRVVEQEFDTLMAQGNENPEGIWSNGTTMWVVDSADNKVYAYNMQTKAYDSSLDFNDLGSTSTWGLWSDGTTIWIPDVTNKKVNAYNLDTKARDAASDINTLNAAGNHNPYGIWQNDTTVWISDYADDKLYAYDATTYQRNSDADFNVLESEGNPAPLGIWSNGETIWVADYSDSIIYGYYLNNQIQVTTQSSSAVQLSWNAVTGASYYILQQATQSNGDYTTVYTGSSTTFVVDNVGTTTVSFQVAACALQNDSNSCSPFYGEQNVTLSNTSAKLYRTQRQQLSSVQTENSNQKQLQQQLPVSVSQQKGSSIFNSQLNQTVVSGDSCYFGLTETVYYFPPNNLSYRWGNPIYGDWSIALDLAEREQVCRKSNWQVATVQQLLQLMTELNHQTALLPYQSSPTQWQFWTSNRVSADKALAVDLQTQQVLTLPILQYLPVILIAGEKAE